jgi:hypothetical protein
MLSTAFGKTTLAYRPTVAGIEEHSFPHLQSIRPELTIKDPIGIEKIILDTSTAG